MFFECQVKSFPAGPLRYPIPGLQSGLICVPIHASPVRLFMRPGGWRHSQRLHHIHAMTQERPACSRHTGLSKHSVCRPVFRRCFSPGLPSPPLIPQLTRQLLALFYDHTGWKGNQHHDGRATPGRRRNCFRPPSPNRALPPDTARTGPGFHRHVVISLGVLIMQTPFSDAKSFSWGKVSTTPPACLTAVPTRAKPPRRVRQRPTLQ
jgi:hypothetical protein